MAVGAVEVCQTYLDNALNANARLLQYPHNILAAHLRLIRDAALDERAVDVRGDLARDEDLGARDDGLGLREVSASAHSYSVLGMKSLRAEGW